MVEALDLTRVVDGASTVLVAREDQEHVRVGRDHRVIEPRAVAREVRAPAVRRRRRRDVGVGEQDAVAVREAREDLARPVRLLLGDAVGQAHRDEVEAAGGEQDVVVLVVLAPLDHLARGARGLVPGVVRRPARPVRRQVVVAAGAVVLVEPRRRTGLLAQLVVVVSGDHLVDQARVVERLLGVRGELELPGDLLVEARVEQTAVDVGRQRVVVVVLDDVTGVTGIRDLAGPGLLGDPLGRRVVGLRPDRALLLEHHVGGLGDAVPVVVGATGRALGEVLRVGEVRQREVVVLRVLELVLGLGRRRVARGQVAATRDKPLVRIPTRFAETV